ncbi:hypothetical protein Isop_1167 [Isosphaera pallida ATCC 43644]|uniref:Uncharacterized protein n=1 Tax=Isosphaera pallida (strain ATCC 43644 / DSM 9630 / IS1B) TaxID=575540 RepID=E8R5K5_ISOPI|nr:hypothetical protein [Isosphaera pallida]ADV61754.1 hypothetical protein Isop_1167 [Isosphaera pallida ATCC 43644]
MSRSSLTGCLDEPPTDLAPVVRVEVEFFGVPRLKAGVPRIQVDLPTVDPAQTVSNLQCLLDRLADMLPNLVGAVLIRDQPDQPATLHPAYRVSRGTDEFLDNPHASLTPNCQLLLLSTDLGG